MRGHPQTSQHTNVRLKAVPKRWSSWDFTVTEGARPVADIDISWWREKGVLTVQGQDYRVYREGLVSGDFVLELAGSVVARAQKPSAFQRAFTIEHDGARYVLQANSAFQRGFTLLERDRAVGSLSPDGLFTRRMAVDLPPALPLAVKVFVIWLTVILWKRASDGAAT